MEAQKILDQFGYLVATEMFDSQYNFILNKIEDLTETEGYKNLFSGMTALQKKEIENYTSEILKGAAFDFLRIFEEHTQFKIIYEENGEKIDLIQLSDMLKAEPVIANGWIQKYSKELNK